MKNAFNFRPWMVLAVLLTYSLGTWAQSITLKGIVKGLTFRSNLGER